MSANKIITELKSFTTDWRRKTSKSQYGYGDQFISVRMPDFRKVAKKYHQRVSFDSVKNTTYPLFTRFVTEALFLWCINTQRDREKNLSLLFSKFCCD